MLRITALLLLLTFAAPAFLISQEEGGGTPTIVVIPRTVKDELRRLLPDSTVVSAAPSAETKFYSSDLFEYIDGGADAYLDYGLVAMVDEQYKSASAEITLDIYNLGSPENAFGIYAAERSPDYHFLPIGTEGYGSDEILNFLQGKFYVKLSAFSDKEKAGPILERLARAVSQRIGPVAPMPDFVSLFPPSNLLPHTIKYVKKAPLGHEFLQPAVMASYANGAKPSSLIISSNAGPDAALKRVETIKAYFATSGKVAPATDILPGAFTASNQFDGNVIFFAANSDVVVCINPPSDPGPWLKSVIDRIRQKDISF